jgi:hypothetical protein
MSETVMFKKYPFELNQEKIITINNGELKIKREKEGWNIIPLNQGGLTVNALGEYFQTGKSNSLVIQPALPNKPLIFKGNNIFISPKQKFTFFIKIPLVVQFCFSKGNPENVFKEITWKRISDSWFGEPDSGEPAFSVGNEYFLDFNAIQPNNLEAVCPVIVHNNSTIALELQRLIIRTEDLTLYKNEGKIVTSVVEIEYKGKDTVSAADYHYSKIYNGEKPEILAKPRNTSGKNLLKLNFQFIKRIYRSE